MNFSEPNALYLLLILPFLGFWMKVNRLGISHPNLGRLGQTQKWSWSQLPHGLPLLSMALWILAMATPQHPTRENLQGEEGIAIEMLLDVSTSMDINTTLGGKRSTRMQVAKRVLKEFVIGDGEQLQGRPNDLIGVITFSRYADTLCPLTLSHEAIAAMIDDIEVNERPNEDGTAYGDATALAAALFRKLDEAQMDEKVKSKVVVLLTDGENNCGRFLPLQAAAMAKEWGVRVYSISLGDPPEKDNISVGGQNLKSERGFSEAEWGLKQLSDSTGGFFSRAHNYETLKNVYMKIDELETSQLTTRSIERWEPHPRPWGIAGLIVLLLAPLLQLLGWRTSTC